MALPTHQNSLSKLELLVKELGFQIRYEKGNFQSGLCFIREKKVVLINKFIPMEQKIQALTSIIYSTEIKVEALSRLGLNVWNELKKSKMVI